MKVTLYMSISANGMIAKSDDDTSWISKEEWDSYSLAVRTAGCLIVGRRTYNILTKQSEFSELKDVKLVVVSKGNFSVSDDRHIVVHSPKEALDALKDFKEVIVAGGGILNASFLAEDLVDEIYLDVEPIIFGQGIPLFKGLDFTKRMELIGQRNITQNEIQLHYRIIK
ncbi:MAG: dihydrofolate reductase family protein [Patescibacteria group bacterium]|jgi:dihydrofolate reductase